MAIEFFVCTVQALNGIGRVDDFPDIVGEFENRAYHIPVLGPALHGVRILWFTYLVTVLSAVLKPFL